jgi:hypothetical protein
MPIDQPNRYLRITLVCPDTAAGMIVMLPSVSLQIAWLILAVFHSDKYRSIFIYGTKTAA